MTWTLRIASALASILAVANASGARAALGSSELAELAAAATAIDELRLEDAEGVLEPLFARHAEDPSVAFEHGLLRYHRGDYETARLQMVGSALRATSLRPASERYMLARIAFETEEATRTFVRTRSADGRFEVRHAPADARMAGFALEVMRRVDRGLSEELGYRHPGPVRLDILPTTEHLARVSSLTVEEIETTGTIALCKWDRLIVTSPRALVYGYPWADTLGHEYVHLVLARMTRDRAPVWVQEGIARRLERRWRGAHEVGALDARSARLLAEALERDRLLPFERLHPSIARLPSADLAALAFAQVSTFIDAFVTRHGADALRAVIGRIARGDDAREAFSAVAGRSFEALERQWQEHVRRVDAARPDPEPLRFRHGAADLDETANVAMSVARDALRLGDLLELRGRHAAARYEYERAYAVLPEDPIVATRLARAAHGAGQDERAVEVLEPVRRAHPEHAPLLALLAVSAAGCGRFDLAREAALESIWLNPFDPEPHCALAGAANDPEIAALAAAACGER